MEPRHHVIDISVQLEYNISAFLAGYLNINYLESRSFRKSSSLSFQQKLNLILDMKVLEKDQLEKLEIFGQIRNKFAHDFDIKTYKDCFFSESGLKKRLEKIYKHRNELILESDCEKIFIRLLKDIIYIGDLLIEKLRIKILSK